MGFGRSLKKALGMNRGGSKGGAAQPAGGQSSPPSTDAEKDAAAQKFMQGARSSGLNRMNVFGGDKSGSAQPQSGTQSAALPRRLGMLGVPATMGTAFSRLQARPGFQEALAKNKAARGNGEPPMAGNRAMGVVNRAFRNGVRNNAPAPAADRPDQTMKKGGSVSARADGIAKKGKTKGRMV